MLEEDQDNMIQKTVMNMTIAHLATCEQKAYKTTTNSTEMVINKHSDEQYDILVRLMEKFKSWNFCDHLQTTINDENETDEKKSKAETLLTMTSKFLVELLQNIYRDGVDNME